jgi:hypothetical protein
VMKLLEVIRASYWKRRGQEDGRDQTDAPH